MPGVRAGGGDGASPCERGAVRSNRYPDPPPWPIYASSRDRLIELVRALDVADAAQPVPLTPDWSIADVLAHLCGLTADVAGGLRTGLGTPERTRHQVRSRAGRSVAAICDEWTANADAMRTAMEEDPFFGHRLTADLTVHLHDILHALGARSTDIDRADPPTRCGAHTYAAVAADLVRDRTGVALRIELDDASAFATSEHADITLRTSPFDWLRTVTGRRSHREVLALDWSHHPTPLLGHLCPYGPLRDDDSGF